MHNGLLYRVSFSRSLLVYIRDRYFPHYALVKFRYRIGKKLEKEESSKTGLFGIISSRTDKALRISLIKECAELLCDYEHRYLTECEILEIKDEN